MTKKTVNFSRSGASKLPTDKPVVYRVKTAGGKINYVGVAKRGGVEDQIKKLLDAGKIPGVKVQIERCATIGEARRKEREILSHSKPKYNLLK